MTVSDFHMGGGAKAAREGASSGQVSYDDAVFIPGTQDVGELLGLCIEGDDQAQARFCAEYFQLVQRAVERKLAALTADAPLRADVDDICNEVFERLLAGNCRALSKLRNASSINAWLVTVAKNHAVDYVRRWSSRVRLKAAISEEPAEYAACSPEETAMAAEKHSLLRQRMAELPAADRMILDLYYVHGLKYSEIAEIMGLNINTLAARLHRAKAKLRGLLEGERHAL